MTTTEHPAGPGLAAVGVTVRYEDRVVLDDVHLAVRPGQTLGLRGPSGTGKTTLLRVLALLHRPDAGHVTLDAEPVGGVRHAVPAATRRRIAVLFQSPRAACDPRLTLHQIIAEPLRVADPSTPPLTAVRELADRVGLTEELVSRRPHAVSDGQLQRACLARALAQNPDYLLTDEATTMVDASTQAHLVAVIRDHQQATGLGVLAVSHDSALLDRWADRTVDLEAMQNHRASPRLGEHVPGVC
jgi:ABC-type dipeptide/oligopeptide/nickel transport system ATPase subunit